MGQVLPGVGRLSLRGAFAVSQRRLQEFFAGIASAPMEALNNDTVRLANGDTHGTGTFLTDWVYLPQR